MLALACGAATTAWAEGADDLRLSAGLGLVHDSNLFRLPSGIDTVPLIGRASPAETVRVTSLGATYQRSYSLQRIELDVHVSDYRYQNFDYLSFLATNYRAAWNWSYTPHLYGVLRTARNQALNSFVDYSGYNQRNVRSDTDTAFDATYELDARWRLKGGLQQQARSNSQPIVSEANYRFSGLLLGVQYVLPSGSSLGYQLRSTDGRYTSRRVIPNPGHYDTDFSQLENTLSATWAISRATQAEFTLGHRSRSNPHYAQRDYSDFLGSARLNWTLSGKTAISAGWARELGSFETADFNYTQTDRFSIGPVWQVSPKAVVRAQFEHAIRDFKGTPAGFVSARRRDTSNDLNLSLDWEPYRFLLLSASLQNSRRSSSAPGFRYNSNAINVNAQFSY